MRNIFKKKEKEEDPMVTSKSWTFYLDDGDVIEKGFMEKLLKSMLREREEKGNKEAPEIVIKMKEKKNGKKEKINN